MKNKCCVEISELTMTALEAEHSDLLWGGDGHLLLQHRTFPRQRGEQHQNLRPFVYFQDFILIFKVFSYRNTPLRPPQWQLLSETLGTHTFKGISFATSDYRIFFPLPRYTWSNINSSQSQDQTIFPPLQHWLSKINTNHLIQSCTLSHKNSLCYKFCNELYQMCFQLFWNLYTLIQTKSLTIYFKKIPLKINLVNARIWWHFQK